MHGKKNITDTLGLNDTAATYHYYDFALSMLQCVEYYEQWHVCVLLPRRFIWKYMKMLKFLRYLLIF